ncbi:MAG: hypothetical protein KJ666_08435 [Bacteroidetes bacterium]|nr:hypothetical protein [Bacteroidota bacterium]
MRYIQELLSHASSKPVLSFVEGTTEIYPVRYYVYVLQSKYLPRWIMPLKNGVKNKNQISNGVNKGILSHGVNTHVSTKNPPRRAAICSPLDNLGL